MGFLLQGWLPASLSHARHLHKILDLLHIDIQGIEQVSRYILYMTNLSHACHQMLNLLHIYIQGIEQVSRNI